MRRGGEEFIQCAAFVGLEVRKADIPQAINGQDPRNRRADDRKQLAQAGMKQQRRVVVDQILVEGESAARDLDWRGDAINAVRDLVDCGAARKG
ncbi:hypothetical protein D3C87_1696800 [compost metagenome]